MYPHATSSQIQSWYVMQRRQIIAHRMMHYTVVNSVQATWHSKQWRQQYWRDTVQPVAACSDRAAEEVQGDAGGQNQSYDIATSFEQPSVL